MKRRVLFKPKMVKKVLRGICAVDSLQDKVIGVVCSLGNRLSWRLCAGSLLRTLKKDEGSRDGQRDGLNSNAHATKVNPHRWVFRSGPPETRGLGLYTSSSGRHQTQATFPEIT